MNSTPEALTSVAGGYFCNLGLYVLFRLLATALPETVIGLCAIAYVASASTKSELRSARIRLCIFSSLFALCLSDHFSSKPLLAAFAIYTERRFSPMLASSSVTMLRSSCLWAALCVTASLLCAPLHCQELVLAAGTLLDAKSGEKRKKEERMLKDTLETIPFPAVFGYAEKVWGNETCCKLFSVKTESEMERFAAKRCIKTPADTRKSLIDSLKSIQKSAQIDPNPVGTIEIQGEIWQWYPHLLAGAGGAVLIGMNVTAQKSFEMKFKNEAMAKAALIRSFSHEVLTPLNSIMYLCSEIHSKYASSEVVTMLKTNCCLLQYVLSDVTDYAEVLSGQLDIVKTDFNLRTSLQHLISLYSYQVHKKGLSLTVSIDPLIPEVIYSDERKLGQVFLNLLSNAVKNTLNGEINVEVCLVDTGQMRVEVSDTGVGIQENCLKTLFSMVVFEDNKGAGFGLYVSSLIAKKLGSRRIYVKSQPSSGSRFWFEVDITHKRTQSSQFVFSPTIYCDAKDVSAIPRPLCSNIQSMCLKNLNVHGGAEVLIVDDNEFNRTILRMMLEKMKISCEEAASGLKAIESILKRGKTNFKLVFMDVEMPEMDGIEATKQLVSRQAAGELESVPKIVALTAYPSYQVRDKCSSAGMAQFLSKPISIEQLKAVVSQYCGAQL